MSRPGTAARGRPAGGDPGPPERAGGGRRAVRWWKFAGIAAGVVVAASAGVAGWRWNRWPVEVRAGLPDEVTPGRLPDALRARLAQARAQLGDRARLVAAVAELGRLYHANGFTAEALACWEVLARVEPREARWPHLRADLLRTAGDYAAYESALRRAVDLAPDDAPAWLQLGGLAFKTGRLAEARTAFQRRLALQPGDPYARLGLVRLAWQEGRRSEARAELEALAREAPEFPTVHNLLAELLATEGATERAAQHRWLGREKGRFREAPDPWVDELVDWCFDAGRLRVLGTIQFQTNQGDRGRALFERAAALSPDDPATHEILGELLLLQNQPGAARAALERARQLAVARPFDGNGKLFVTLASAERALRDPARALDYVAEGIARAGETAELLAARGDALLELGRGDEALAAYRLAVARDPAAAETHQKIAMLLLDTGNRALARRHLEQALESQPTLPAVLRLLGRLEMDAGEWESAGRRFGALYESNPGVPLAPQLYGEWHQRWGAKLEARGETERALGHFREAARLAPENAAAQESLGVLLLVGGRLPEALPALEAFRRIQPQNPQACLYLGQVYARLGRIPEAKSVLTEGARLAERAGNRATAEFCREILRGL